MVRVDKPVPLLFEYGKAGMARAMATFDEHNGLIRGDGTDGASQHGSLVALDIDLDEVDRSPLSTHIVYRYQMGVLPAGFYAPVHFFKRLFGSFERRGAAG